MGGGSGLGATLTGAFAEDFCLSVLTRDRTRVTAAHPVKVFEMPTNESEVNHLVEESLHDFYDLVIVCSGGGFGKRREFEDYQTLQEVGWANFGIAYCLLKSLTDANRLSTFLVIGSVAARDNLASPAYALAKVQLEKMVRIYGRKLVPKGVALIGLSLGGILADGNAMDRLRINNHESYEEFLDKRLPRRKFLAARDVINFVRYVLSSEDSTVLAGSVVVLDGGESTHL